MMKKRFFRCAVFAVIFVALLFAATKVLVVKFMDDNCQTYMAEGLYALDKNSVEVAISGSSQAVFCVSGMELYEKYGISSYSMGSPDQPISCSLAWLRELNQRQSIKIAALDVSQLFETNEELSYRQAFDPMHLSNNKIEMVRWHVEQNEDADSMISYLFPLIKYHSRWNEVTKQDFGLNVDTDAMFLGNALSSDVCSFDGYDDFALNENLMNTEIVEEQCEALWDYAQYCEENDIELVLFKTPKSDWCEKKSQQVQDLAKSVGVPYLDYTTREGCAQAGIDFYADFKDAEHLNTRGAEKISRQLGAYFEKHYDLTDYRETAPKSEEFMENYHKQQEKIYFESCTNPVEYLETVKKRYLSKDEYDIVCQITDGSIKTAWTDALQMAWESCGLTTDPRELNNQAYVGCVANGETEEWIGDSHKMTIDDFFGDDVLFRATSKANLRATTVPKISIIGSPKTFSAKGMNILVYRQKTQETVSMATIFLCADGQLRIYNDSTSKK